MANQNVPDAIARPQSCAVPPPFAYRPEESVDIPFLRALYASTREQELATTDWSMERKRDFLAQQFSFQHRYYREHFSDAAFDIVMTAGQPVGRRYVLRRKSAIVLIDMALLPAWRGHGIGTVMLAQVIDEARAGGRTVTLHVEHDNPAARLYARAGFEGIGTNGVYRKMQWTPPPSAHETSTLTEIHA